jgi:hypothetical protein
MRTIQRFLALSICSMALLNAAKPVPQTPTLDYTCATNSLGECLAGQVVFLGTDMDRLVGVEVTSPDGSSLENAIYGTSQGVLSFTESTTATGTYTVNLYTVKGHSWASTPFLTRTFTVGAPDTV